MSAIYTRLLAFLALITIASVSSAQLTQSWVKGFVSDGAQRTGWEKIEVDTEGNIFLLGRAMRASDELVLLFKYGPDGQFIWGQAATVKQSVGEVFMELSPAHAFIGVKNLIEPGVTRFEVYRHNVTTGAFMNLRLYDQNGTEINDMEQDAEGNLVLVGSIGLDGLVLKWKSDLEVVWEKNFNLNSESFSSVAIDPQGNVYACGSVNGEIGNSSDGLIVNFSRLGVLGWSRTFDGGFNGDDSITDVLVGQNSLFVTGKLEKGSETTAMVLKRYDLFGGLQWSKEEPAGLGGSVQLTPTLDVLVNYFNPTANLRVLSRYQPDGVRLWRTEIPSKAPGMYDAGFLGSDFLIVGGNADGAANQIHKVGGDGQHLWTIFPGPTNLATTNGYFSDVLISGLTNRQDGIAAAFLSRYFHQFDAVDDIFHIAGTQLSVAPASGLKVNDRGANSAGIEIVTQPKYGTVVSTGNGGFNYNRTGTPPEGFDSFTYRLKNVATFSNAAKATIYLPARIKSFRLERYTVGGGSSVQGTVELTAPATGGGEQVALSDNTSVITVPESVFIAPQTLAANFTVQTSGVTATATRQIYATFKGVRSTINLTITPATLNRVLISPSTVTGGAPSQGTIEFTGTVAQNTTVNLTDNSSAITVPASVVLASGKSTGAFQIATAQVFSTVTRQVTATLASVTRSASITLIPGPTIKSFTLTPSTVKGGNSSSAAVEITVVAPSGGTQVAMSDNTSSITTPPFVTVQSGNTKGSVLITTSKVTATATRQVTVSLNGSSRTLNLTLTP